MQDLPFIVGALYNRRLDIHAPFGGQRQGGISTPVGSPIVFAFTGDAGKSHGYSDFWETESLFHYFGEGQRGDMTYTGGNRAILRHDVEGKRLLLFRAMGHGRPYRFEGEMTLVDSYELSGVPDTEGRPRKAIVFRLKPVEDEAPVASSVMDSESAMAIADTVAERTVEVRRTQTLFRRRLIGIEKECRLTGVRDLRFVRASHIKPWASCQRGEERTDGYNGLILTPTADHLFDRGWISFEADGRLLTSQDLPTDVAQQIKLNLRSGRRCGDFHARQQPYLDFHRNEVFSKRYAKHPSAADDLLKAIAS